MAAEGGASPAGDNLDVEGHPILGYPEDPTMEEDVHRYAGDEIDVTYDVNRCIHVKACVEGLPGVFDPDARPGVRPDGPTRTTWRR